MKRRASVLLLIFLVTLYVGEPAAHKQEQIETTSTKNVSCVCFCEVCVHSQKEVRFNGAC